ncbi:23S rRNA (adenine(2503)-C(2))-methyltransferase RlmN [bacterium]
MIKKDIYNLSFDELGKFIVKISAQKFRTKQIFEWLYKKGVQDFEQMLNIPGELRDKLREHFYSGKLLPKNQLLSEDDTEKVVFELKDKHYIETVMIPVKNRNTLCISTQVGCKFSCAFCASGKRGFGRNLTVGEILQQVMYFVFVKKYKITNIVYMGMGEPLDNYENVTKSIQILNDANGLNFAARRITVSTSGLVPMIEKLKSFKLQINLSISLHAANQTVRAKIMPIAKMYSLDQLVRAAIHYYEKTNRQITLEYILMKDVNDTNSDASGLVDIAKKLKAKVNLIPYSPITKSTKLVPDAEAVQKFTDFLMKRHVTVTVRESKGKDIFAACGQLAGA